MRFQRPIHAKPAGVIATAGPSDGLWIRRMWSANGSRLIAAASILMGVMSAMMLIARFTRLLSTPGGAIDLRYFFDWSHVWFKGQPVYAEPDNPPYPPASMPILWLLLGWLSSFDQARLWWAVLDAIALTSLAIVFIRATGAEGLARRAFVALLLSSMTATGAAVGNGQLILPILPIFLIAVVVLPRRAPGWPRDIAAALLLAFTLVKPTISAPFFWVACLAYGMRPILLAGAAYVGLTLFAAAFQDATLWDLLKTCIMNGAKQATIAPDVNLNFALWLLGLGRWMLPASALALGLLGVWTFRHRRQDIWILLGVAALVARLWTYHRLYDGVLVTVAEVALFRLASRRFGTDGIGVTAGVLLAATVGLFLFPGPAGPGGLFPRVALALLIGQAVMTLIDLLFLLYAGSLPSTRLPEIAE